jgi:hypothetical protein
MLGQSSCTDVNYGQDIASGQTRRKVRRMNYVPLIVVCRKTVATRRLAPGRGAGRRRRVGERPGRASRSGKYVRLIGSAWPGPVGCVVGEYVRLIGTSGRRYGRVRPRRRRRKYVRLIGRPIARGSGGSDRGESSPHGRGGVRGMLGISLVYGRMGGQGRGGCCRKPTPSDGTE